ncbi:C-type lectin mannose-binding isoform-like [Musca autumnalis]|uniref:C-type lectin mannose-binding isoform-like n=1 Tax=Musca autumnalis TaxID=221902 RepID=UPI003CF2E122
MNLLTIDSSTKSDDVEQVLKVILPNFPRAPRQQPPSRPPSREGPPSERIRRPLRKMTSFYIGGNDLGDFRKFIWTSNGHTFNYTNWARNEPNNMRNSNERCVLLGFFGTMQWNDVNCYWLAGYICEY